MVLCRSKAEKSPCQGYFAPSKVRLYMESHFHISKSTESKPCIYR